MTVGNMLDENGYYTGSDGAKYAKCDGEYFKVEPIVWQIVLKQSDSALIVSESILANLQYHPNRNRYKDSDVRYWLNRRFYPCAFSEAEKNRIMTSDVDNSVESTGISGNPYAGENTQDKVFLLSYREAFECFGLTDADRQKRVTPFAEKTGTFVHKDTACGWWWLRSPDDSHSYDVRIVDDYGEDYYSPVYYDSLGVVPALKIKL